jgi:hypothetical protein
MEHPMGTHWTLLDHGWTSPGSRRNWVRNRFSEEKYHTAESLNLTRAGVRALSRTLHAITAVEKKDFQTLFDGVEAI